MKRVAIMQPYFMPYIGYFQLINSVDEFVIYDTIQYTKKGWINRNRILVNGKDYLITIPIKKGSDYLDVNQRYLADTKTVDLKRILQVLETTYKRAPYFTDAFPIIEKCILNDKINLFEFIYDSVIDLISYLNIKTKITKSSEIQIDHTLRSNNKVLAICKEQKADVYINAIGGRELYNRDEFMQHGITLKFIKSNPIIYSQYKNDFVPWLSIIDVLMFNPKDTIIQYLNSYTLI